MRAIASPSVWRGAGAGSGNAPKPSRVVPRFARRLIAKLMHSWISFVSVFAVLAAWYLISASGIVSTVLLPGPQRVGETFLTVLREGYRGTSLAEDVWATLYRCLLGFALAVAVGIPLGLAIGSHRKIAAIFDIPIQFMRPLPGLAYLILLILWFGSGDASKIAMLFLSAFPVLVTATAAGVRTTKIQHIQVAQSLGADPWQVFRYVIFPSALAPIFTGMRIALALTFGAVVAAEIIVSTDGLGWMISSASEFLRNDIIMMAIIILGALGMALSYLIANVDHRVVHWRGRD